MADVRETPLVKQNAGDHLANERTFLAWMRTSIGIMGFGFVVVKFSLFVRQISIALGTKPAVPQTGYSSVIGIALVGLGALIIVFSFIRYLNIQKHLSRGTYYQSSVLMKVTTALIFLISILLILYLMKSVS